MKYIFVHIPKTAGTSFRFSLADKLSSLWDYGADSPNTSDEIKSTIYSGQPNKLVELVEKEQVGFVSGHFPASKYKEIFPDAKLVAFVREPVDRVISEYNHHVRLGGYTQPIEVFCASPVHRNKQYGCFSGLSIDDFHFVGLTEKYAHSLSLFNDTTGLELQERRMNLAKNQERKSLEVSRSDLAESVIEHIKQENAEDMKLYAAVKEKFLAVPKV